MMDPEIEIKNLTVVIPTYKRLDMLKKILDSIPRSIRVVVSDNGSSVPDSFILEYPEFKFFKTDRLLEALENWNHCIDLVDTEWFTIPSDDDLYYHDSFEIISKYMDLNEKSDLIIFGHNVIDEKDNILSTWKPTNIFNIVPPGAYSTFKYGVDARFPGMIFKKKLVVSNDCFDTSYKITAGDSKLIQKCLLNGTVSFIAEVIAAYRVWPNNSTALTMASAAWLNEIDRWQEEILAVAESKYSEKGLTLSVKKIKDEVYARNFAGGISNKKKSAGFFSAMKFIFSNRYPYHANLKTQLRIVLAVLK